MAARWYDPEKLEIVIQVPSADKKKLVNATITHARKLGFLPSVTTVLKEVLAAGPMLNEWIIEQHLQACINFPFDGDPKQIEAVEQYKKMVCAKANEFRDQAADKGKILHGYLEDWVKSKKMPDDPVGRKIISKVEAKLKEIGAVSVTTERVIGSKKAGCAGKPDLYIECKDHIHIPDFKTTSFRSFRTAYDSWKSQLGGYYHIKETEHAQGDVVLENWVADRDTGDMLFLPHEEPEKWKRHFVNILDCWTIQNNYNPRELKV